MGKLRVLSGRDVSRILQAHGFVVIRQRGCHLVLQRRVEATTITVPVPDHAELKTGTLLSIIRQSGLPRALFEALRFQSCAGRVALTQSGRRMEGV